MTAATSLRFRDDSIEMLRTGPRTVVRDRSSGRVFEVDSAAVPADLEWQTAGPRCSSTLLRWLVALLLVGLVGGISLVGPLAADVALAASTASQWWLVVVYVVVQTALHETCHVVALRINGRRPDKVGVKLNFAVFPAVYVRMNDVHLLHRNDKIVVHTAGLLVNGIVNLILLLACLAGFVPELALAVVLYTPGLLANSLPLLRSDGHKTLLAALGINERRRMRDNVPLVRVLHAASWVMAVVSTTTTLVYLLS